MLDNTNPLLSFLISMRHPDNSTDYAQVEALLRKTLASLCRQRSSGFGIVVVANRAIDLPKNIQHRVRQIIVSFPPPSTHRGSKTGHDAVLRDKGTKLAVALSAVRQGHVMFVDADDYVNADMTGFVAQNPSSPGWYVSDGLVFDHLNYRTSGSSRFNEICGTSLIVRRDLLPQPTLRETPTQQDVLDAYDESVVLRHLGSHRHLAADLDLAPLPFPGAMYSVATGENHSGATARRPGVPLSVAQSRMFALPLRYVAAARAHQVRSKLKALAQNTRTSS